jgi:mannose-6-phosphate isomerase-like protein (cupin superfamily)
VQHFSLQTERFWAELSGTGRIKVGEDRFDLEALDAVRVAPGSARELEASRSACGRPGLRSHPNSAGRRIGTG